MSTEKDLFIDSWMLEDQDQDFHETIRSMKQFTVCNYL